MTDKNFQKNFSEIEASGAFVESLVLEPLGSGELDGLSFSVKDNIHIAGHNTSFGNPSWRDLHSIPRHNALCVDQLLNAGATCVGKVVADEFTYSLDGESHHFGTPSNPKAPGRIPGGSSSGSASSVACRLADFSLATDSGGSIRVPASLCGVWGMRPSLHRISEAGILPFMPSVSTVGVIAAHLDILNRTMRVLLRSGIGKEACVRRIIALRDAFDLADEEVCDAARLAVERIAARMSIEVEYVRFSDIVGSDLDLIACNEKALRNLQTAEFQNTVGDWIEDNKPECGPAFSQAYKNVETFNRSNVFPSLELCERLFEQINLFLLPGTIVCFPTTPAIAPRRGALKDIQNVLDFYTRTMSVTCFSGVGRLPEITAPLLAANGCPVGLSFAAGHYQDEFLLTATHEMLSA